MPDDAALVRRLAAGDSLGDLTRLLNDAYATLARAGLRYVATWQDADVTRRRLAGGECYVAVAGGRMVGTVTFYGPARGGGHPWYERADVAHFGQLGVLPRHRGRGIGAALLERVEDRARETGAREVACDTAAPAADLLAMYARRGYRRVGEANWPQTNYRSVILSKRIAPKAAPAAPPGSS